MHATEPAPPADAPPLTAAEAARLLRTTDSTIRKWATVGCPVAGQVVVLRSEMIGTRYYFSRADLEAFKAECAAARAADAADADDRRPRTPPARGATTADALAALAAM
jgi:hypothetical protein